VNLLKMMAGLKIAMADLDKLPPNSFKLVGGITVGDDKWSQLTIRCSPEARALVEKLISELEIPL